MQIICWIILLLVVNVVGKSDFEALLDLKEGIKEDPPGKFLASWDSKVLDSNDCPDNWYGITCSNGRVISIALNGVNLVGEFDFAALSSLTMLTNLSISNNRFTGSIPKVGSINSLQFLDLSSNEFHGSVPSALTDLSKLVLLNLSSNKFDGNMPSGFGKLGELKYLDLHSNGLSGNVMHFLGQMGSVLYIDLSCNKFDGSLDLGLANASLISSIQYLNISNNILVEELFAHDGMPFFDSLEVFDASNNQFTGSLPSFNFVVSLRILRLRSNQLSGSLPEALLQESSMLLSELDLSLNQFEGPVGVITSMTLRKLNLSSNKLSGSLPASIGHCAIIDVSNNMLSGNIVRIQSWGNYVEFIQLSSNSLMGTLPNRTSQFLRLVSFQASNNSLEGGLPLVLGTYPELKVIDLSHNQLNGSVPPFFFDSTKFTVVNLSNNQLSGSIPIVDTLNATSISLSQNFPLMSVNLSHNSLTGHLPRGFGKFLGLEYLNLSSNLFQGSIPDELPNSLTGFDVSFNNLSGLVPENLWRFPASSFFPGNSLLIFPPSPSSPKEGSGLTINAHQPHLKPAMRIILILGSIGVAVMVLLLCILIFYRAKWRDCQRRSSPESGEGKKGVLKEKPSKSEPAKDENILFSSTTFHQSVAKKSKSSDSPESVIKEEKMSSPMSFTSSSTPSNSKTHQLPENLGAIKVCSPDKLAGDLHILDGSLAFTAEELSRAPAEIIGRSCHGTLYKATLHSGHVLTVKWLREGTAKGKKEFAREVKKLGSIKHPNLVSVNGYYWGPKDHEKLLISSFINAQSLASYLQETEVRKLKPLSLIERLRIGLDIARCLNYLHNEKSIPHGNLKSTNVLLESPAMSAQVTDYSLHRILTPAATAEQVLNAGALGYRPPEFANSCKPCPSLKSDVYAFGVILLELLTGKSSGEIVSGISGVVDMTDWVRFLVSENRTIECLDSTLINTNGSEKSSKFIEHMMEVALKCTLPASERPDMKTVFEDLSVIVQQQ